MTIHHSSDHPDSFGIIYTGEACERERTRELSRLVGQRTGRDQVRLSLPPPRSACCAKVHSPRRRR